MYIVDWVLVWFNGEIFILCYFYFSWNFWFLWCDIVFLCISVWEVVEILINEFVVYFGFWDMDKVLYDEVSICFVLRWIINNRLKFIFWRV